jgi:hypothetical protein
MNAEQIIARTLEGLPDSLFNQQQARRIAFRLREAGLLRESGQRYEQIGWWGEMKPDLRSAADDSLYRFSSSLLKSSADSWLVDPLPVYVRRPAGEQQ